MVHTDPDGHGTSSDVVNAGRTGNLLGASPTRVATAASSNRQQSTRGHRRRPALAGELFEHSAIPAVFMLASVRPGVSSPCSHASSAVMILARSGAGCSKGIAPAYAPARRWLLGAERILPPLQRVDTVTHVPTGRLADGRAVDAACRSARVAAFAAFAALRSTGSLKSLWNQMKNITTAIPP